MSGNPSLVINLHGSNKDGNKQRETGERREHELYIADFFFSSRRRHTRFDCDWSSDVCSSDLDSPYRNRNAITPTKGGNTAGRAMSEPRVFRPGKSSHSNRNASGTPIAAASATLATEIQTLAHSTRHSPGRDTNAARASDSAASCTTITIGYSTSHASSRVNAARAARPSRVFTRAPRGTSGPAPLRGTRGRPHAPPRAGPEPRADRPAPSRPGRRPRRPYTAAPARRPARRHPPASVARGGPRAPDRGPLRGPGPSSPGARWPGPRTWRRTGSPDARTARPPWRAARAARPGAPPPGRPDRTPPLARV